MLLLLPLLCTSPEGAAHAWAGSQTRQSHQTHSLGSDNQPSGTQSNRFVSTSGRIDFVSDAPLEIINAWSVALRGLLEPSGAFAFSVNMASFQGFNSGLQRQHFQENYLEISRFTKATFEGHLIESPELSKPGTYPVRVRGQLTIHGVTRERILPGSIQVMPDKSLELSTTFDIPLLDHGINIPKIMHQKIAESVRVTVNARLAVPS